MSKYLWPWQSHIMEKFPWEMPIVFIILAVLLSFLTWFRKK